MTRKYPIVQPGTSRPKRPGVKPPYDITGNIIAYEDSQLNREQTIELFQHLIDNGMAWTLQGSYGQQARRLIEAGLCHERKP